MLHDIFHLEICIGTLKAAEEKNGYATDNMGLSGEENIQLLVSCTVIPHSGMGYGASLYD